MHPPDLCGENGPQDGAGRVQGLLAQLLYQRKMRNEEEAVADACLGLLSGWLAYDSECARAGLMERGSPEFAGLTSRLSSLRKKLVSETKELTDAFRSHVP